MLSFRQMSSVVSKVLRSRKFVRLQSSNAAMNLQHYRKHFHGHPYLNFIHFDVVVNVQRCHLIVSKSIAPIPFLSVAGFALGIPSPNTQISSAYPGFFYSLSILTLSSHSGLSSIIWVTTADYWHYVTQSSQSYDFCEA